MIEPDTYGLVRPHSNLPPTGGPPSRAFTREALTAISARESAKAAVWQRRPYSWRSACHSLARLVLVCLAVSGNAGASEPLRGWVERVVYANTLVDQGKLAQAEAQYIDALDEAYEESDWVRVGVVLLNLGRVHDRQGQLLQAQKDCLQAIAELARPGAVDDDRYLVRVIAYLSGLYIQTGQYAKAESAIARVARDSRHGSDPDLAVLLVNAGLLRARRGEYRAAEATLREALELCGGTPSMGASEVRVVALSDLASLRERNGRMDEALAVYGEAAAFWQAIPNPSPVVHASSLGEFVRTTAKMGDYNSADALYRKAIGVAQAELGDVHPVYAAILAGYAELLRACGRGPEARKLSSKATEIRNRSMRENLTGLTVAFEPLQGSN